MADFSLGAAGGRNRQRQVAEEVNEGIPPESLFLYSGGGSARGFELWQRHQQQINQRHQQQQLYSASSGALLAFGSADEPIGPGPTRTGTRGGGGGGGGGGMSCQDCGNQAKKDCQHMRCRTCCKSRGFQCPTHVRSTWVPAAKRRERQQQLASLQQAHPSPTCHRATAGEAPKRPRELSTRPPTIVTTTTTSGGTEGMLSFPAELSSPAVFRCVRVSPVEEVEDQFAYQTAVTIGGHVFKGILYDQGPESSSTAQYHRGDSSSAAAAGVAGIESTANTTNSVMGTTAGSLPDPSSLYPTPLSAFMAGTQFFPHHPRQ